MRRSRSAVQSWRCAGADEQHPRRLPRPPGRMGLERLVQLPAKLAAGARADDLAAGGRRRDPGSSAKSSSSNTGTTSRSASSSLGGPLAHRDARRLVHRVHRQAVSVMRIAACPRRTTGAYNSSGQPLGRNRLMRPARTVASWQIAVVLAACATVARCHAAHRGSRGGQETQFITQGDAARRLLAAARAPGRGRPRRRRRLRRLLLPGIEWDWGDGTESESSEDCEPYKRASAPSSAGSPPSTSSGRPAPTACSSGSSRGTRVVAAASTNVQVRAGVRDDFGD